MKPIAANVFETVADHKLFFIREINLPYFATEFHFHKECQLVYVVESEGKRIIGDNVEHFESDELIFLGSNVPHVWHNDQQYFDKDAVNNARSIALFINPTGLIEHLGAFGNTKKIQAMLSKAESGMKFFGKAKTELTRLLKQMVIQKELPAAIILLQIVQIISTTKEFGLLVSSGYVNNYQNKDNERMDAVFKYVFNHYKREIPLSNIAKIAGMNKQAFCRYFKIRTQKSFMQFVNEIRIGEACKLLAGSDKTVIQIAYDCGFNSITNFNGFFKTIKGITPREFRKQLNN